MNIKNLSIALITALAYEIVLKVSHLLFPSIVNSPVISSVVSFLIFIIGIIIILFLFFFYSEEKLNKSLRLIIKILLGVFILNFLLQLPLANKMINPGFIRSAEEIFGFITSICLFLFVFFYKREIPSTEKSSNQAAAFVLMMFGIGIIKSLYSLFLYFRFLISGVTSLFPPLLFKMMYVLFLITHLSMICFLYRYYQLKSR